MKRISLLIASLVVTQLAVAQNPKAVLKSLTEGNIAASTERFDKISDKTREKMPEMCYLAEAALLNMPKQSGENKLKGYKILAEHIHSIVYSLNAEKTFHGLDISLGDVIQNIENESCNYVIEQDLEKLYTHYIALAKQADHHRLAELEQCLEQCRYNGIVKCATITACNFFLSTYPNSSYYDEVATILMNLRFEEAMSSQEECVVENFIADYPNNANINLAENHLMNLRYERIFSTKELSEMKWFVELYPEHERMAEMKQTMADLEYPTLADSREELARFVAYYPTTTQAQEAQNRIDIFDILEHGDFGKFIRYIVRNGRDSNFYAMQCQVVKAHGYVVLSEQFDNVLLIRFANRDGKVGYCDLDGNIILEPIFNSEFERYFYQLRTDDLEECTAERGLAIVSLNGNQAVINANGEYLIEPKHKQVAFWSEGIAVIKSKKYHDDGEWEWSEHTYDLYDYDGNLVMSNQKIEHGSDVALYANWDTSWFTGDVHFKDSLIDVSVKELYINGKMYGNVMGGLVPFNDNYKLFNCFGDGQTHIINRVGEVLALNIILQDTSCLFGNVVGTKVPSWKNVIIDLDTREILSYNEYKEIDVMRDERILVKLNDYTYAFLDSTLSLAIPYHFSKAHRFCYGSAAVCGNNCWYLINKQGEQISATYEDLAPLVDYNGLYVVMNDGKYGIIDAFGNVVVAIQYELPNDGWQMPIYLQSHNAGIVKWNGGIETQLFNVNE